MSTELTLEPGSYLLRLQMADGEHRALAGDQYRAEVPITVDAEAPAEQVMFIKPADGATVTSPFLVAWAANGMIIETAGKVIRDEGGHLHVLIDTDFVPAGETIPADEAHLHGYDVSGPVAPGKTSRLAFSADVPGRFELELEQRGVVLAEIEVRP